MACERWREMLSAQLDGEDDPADRARVEEHVAGCAGCREWLDRAATVNRLTRTGLVTDVPDLSAAILAALPDAPAAKTGAGNAGRLGKKGRLENAGAGKAGRLEKGRPEKTRRRLSAGPLYVALAAVGAVQLILGLAQVGGGASGGHVHTGLDATPGHLWHESAAWNVAVGAAFLFIALRRNRPAALVPMLTAFVGMLLLLSVNDLSAARVDATRLVSHGFVILGYLLVVALSRVTRDSARPPGAREGGGNGWHFVQESEEGEADGPALPRLRLVPRGGPLTAALEEPEHRQAA